MSERSQRHNGKFIVGVTGNIATGKSVVMRLAADAGAMAIDADRLVHEIMDRDQEMQAAIAVAFGHDVRRPDGRIDRQKLGDIVFSDEEALADLEAMVHPAVRAEIMERVADSDRPAIFIEAIKLLESDLAKSCEQVWVTRATKQRQLERLRVCRGMDTPSAVTRIKAQPPQEEKVAVADVVIDTNGYMAETKTQFESAWARLPESVRVAAAIPSKPAKRAKQTRSSRPAVVVEEPRAGEEAAAPAEPSEPAVTEKTAAGNGAGAKAKARPEGVEVRRARPSDIPSILLLIQKATDGAVKMKRAELLMALSERGYFIGQQGSDVTAVMGWSIDSQVARIDEIYIHPLEATADTGLAIIQDIEESAKAHICELIVAFIPEDAAEEIWQLFDDEGFAESEKESLPRAWRSAIDESQPDATSFMIKILRDERLKRSQAT